MKESESIYVHGTAPAEQRRLAMLSALLDRRELALLDLAGNERVLDLGSGLGIFARAMARLAAVMLRAVRPGRRVVLCDDDHPMLVLEPEPEGFAELWDVYWRHYRDLGNDPLIGRRLVGLLAGAGAEIVRTETIHFGGARGESHFEVRLANLAGVIESARERLLEAGSVDPTRFTRNLRELREWGSRREATIWYALPWVEARRPALAP